jgi:putative ABC transport system substrate-binding protein
MRRRDFITLLGGAAAAWPLAARAQQPGRLPIVAFLGSGTEATQGRWVAAFVQRLRELSWIEGRTVSIEYRWAEGRTERFAAVASELIRLNPAVIVTTGSAAYAAKQATSVIPIVFTIANDPVGSGLVASLTRPGGNITGLSVETTDLSGKRLEILREVVPGLRRLAVLADLGNPSNALDLSAVEEAARTLGLDEIVKLDVRRAEDIASVFDTIKNRADAVYATSNPLFFNAILRINILAVGARLPTMYGYRELVEAGGLVSYGPSFPSQFQRAADFVDKILHGTKPADIPVEQPTKFELVVNLTTARALGLVIPDSFLLRADAVIE